MPVNPISIQSQVRDLIKKTQAQDPAVAEETFVIELTSIITKAILSATVTVTIPSGAVSIGSSPAVIPTPIPIPLTGSLL